MEIIQQVTPEERKVYQFTNFDLRFVLSSYELQIKPKGKRKWLPAQHWDKLNQRDSNIPEPELPLDVIQAAEFEAKKMVQVMSWSDWKALK